MIRRALTAWWRATALHAATRCVMCRKRGGGSTGLTPSPFGPTCEDHWTPEQVAEFKAAARERTGQVTALKHRTVELDGDHFWLVYGPDGVISWTLLPNGTYGPIGIHSPTPMFEGHTPINDCPWLEGPCCADSGFLGGDQVGRTWEEAGRDDDVIWPVLEAWYAAHLPRKADR